MRSYDMLSDHDFELLVADLLGAEDKVVYEAFARGADLGVDLRHLTLQGPIVIQCKHMHGSSYAQLKAAVAKEAVKVAQLKPVPKSYRLVTSQRLTAARKQELARLLRPWVTADDQIIGAEGLEGLLNRHERVERAHVKLWLASSAQLDERLHAATWSRSRQLHAEIRAWLPRYVESSVFWRARQRLRDERVLVVTGPPGIGKTTLARMLLADATVDGYEPIELSEDINEGFNIINDYDARVFYFDDFLGSTFLQDRLAKNEDKRLTSFMRRCSESRNNILVLTTREHILQQAVSWYEELERAGLSLRRFLLELESYSRFERARIFYNHVWHSGQLHVNARIALLSDRAFLKIVDHDNYNPRLIEYVTGLASKQLGAEEQADYVGFAVGVLNNPDIIWERAFERQLDEDCRSLLLTVATMPGQAALEDLRVAFTRLSIARGRMATISQFRTALRVLDDSFTRSHEESSHTFVSVANPSVEDFAAAWLNRNQDEVATMLTGLAYFEQLQWVFRRIQVEKEHSKAIYTALEEAIKRTWDGENPRWEQVYFEGDPDPWAHRADVVLADRLHFVFSVMTAHSAVYRSLEAWLDERLPEAAQQWTRRLSDPSRPVALITILRKHDYKISRAVLESARDKLREMNYSYAWSEMAKLRSIAPEIFDKSTDSRLTSDCKRWIARSFGNPDEIRDTDELWSIRRAAEAMGVDIDEAVYDRLYDEIMDRDDRPSSTPDDADPKHHSDSMSPAQELVAIDALFARLVEVEPQNDFS